MFTQRADKQEQFNQFWEQQGEWSQKTFGTDAERNQVGPLKHLKKEVQEALDNLDDPSEIVDCFFLVIDAARRSKLFEGPIDFLVHAFIKLEINKKRKWQKPTSDEPVEHIRDSETK